MCVQLADSTIRYPEGIAKNVLVRVCDSFVLADFVVMDIEGDLGVVGRGEICFRVGKENMFFRFKLKKEQCILNQ